MPNPPRPARSLPPPPAAIGVIGEFRGRVRELLVTSLLLVAMPFVPILVHERSLHSRPHLEALGVCYQLSPSELAHLTCGSARTPEVLDIERTGGCADGSRRAQLIYRLMGRSISLRNLSGRPYELLIL